MARTTPNMPMTVAPDPAGVPNNADTGGDLGAAARAEEAMSNAKPRPHRARIALSDIHKTYGKKGRRK